LILLSSVPSVVESFDRDEDRVEERHIKFVDLQSQYAAVAPELDAAIASVIRRSAFIGGEETDTFERWFADYCGVAGAVGVSSGTAALELTLEALGVSKGDEVITAANTFIATVTTIVRVGAKPVLVDVDERTANLDPALLECAITPRTKAIMPVHLYGAPADVDRIAAVARGIPIVEDACQAHGATYHGRRAGSLGVAGCFSFYPAKNLGAFGDGGLVTSDDADLLARIRLLRDHGRISKYEHAIFGQTARLDNIQSAILHVQAQKLEEWNANRRRAAARYMESLAGSDVTLLEHVDGAEPAYHLFVIRSPQRDAIRDALAARGVGTGIHYPIPIHLQPACRDLGYAAGDFPISEWIAAEVLSLPMHPFLTDEDVDYVSALVRSAALAGASAR
jgi:dTDP-4-amino-4,6-dideoxygalactose transaminase